VAAPQAGNVAIVLDGVLTIRTTDEARARLTDALARAPTVSVDCSAATEVDVSLIQLLLAARRSAARNGGQLILAQPADGALLATLLRGGFIAAGGPSRGADDDFWLQTTSRA
jgi:ABC-type transporter Mla MlaB component